MAANTKYKRTAIALMRDGIKSNYNKASSCEICGSSNELELHHYHTVSLLVKSFAKEFQLDFNDQEIVLSNRTAFYEKYWEQLVVDTVTLCAEHHKLLHKVYTKEPPLYTSNKQKMWVQKQKEKLLNPTSTEKKIKKSGFGKFLK